MPRKFKPVRFFVMMALFFFLLCSVTAFYAHRAAHGRSPEERTGYDIGEKLGMNALAGATLPNPAELNMVAQAGFKKAHRQ